MANLLRKLLVCLLLQKLYALKSNVPFNEPDSSIFQTHKNAKVSAFADLNSDKTTDLILISIPDKVLQVYYGGDDGGDTKDRQLFTVSDPANIKTVVPGDFDGDLTTDFLLVHKLSENNLYRLELCIGVNHQCQNATEHSVGQPMILDYNGDMRPDILFQDQKSNLTILQFQPQFSNFSSVMVESGSRGRLLPAHSSAFVDLNRDLSADVVLTTDEGLVISLNQNGELNWDMMSCDIKWPEEITLSTIGMSSFFDLDSDSYMDVMTSSTSAAVTTFYVISGEALNNWLQGGCERDTKPGWNRLYISLADGDRKWSLSTADSWLRHGDVDNDGYFDLLVTLVNNVSGDRRPFILHNTECEISCYAKKSRTFSVQWDWLPVQHNISQVALFDMHHDGRLDVLYNAEVGGGTELHLLTNNVAKQDCFVSVKVGSGLCPYNQSSTCTKVYGNIIGPTIQFASTHPDGSEAFGIATQLTQSTNGALQLPYVQFGLGMTPNFVDSLTVGIVRQSNQPKWTETWKTIIPNSHLVVVPMPPDNPDKWLMHLYVTPSQMVLVTGLVILGLCALVAIIIAILHIKEKYEDRKVKLQESHRFHFNAM